jgi:hypothetical protein
MGHVLIGAASGLIEVRGHTCHRNGGGGGGKEVAEAHVAPGQILADYLLSGHHRRSETPWDARTGGPIWKEVASPGADTRRSSIGRSA